MSEGELRKLSDLRVVDLRAELEKRGLEKIGVKAALIERLSKALRDEGEDPETYIFTERAKRASASNRDETDNDASNAADDTSKASEDSSVQDKISDIDKELKNKENPEKTEAAIKDENEDSLHLTIEEDDDYPLLDETDEKQTNGDEESKPDSKIKEEEPTSVDNSVTNQVESDTNVIGKSEVVDEDRTEKKKKKTFSIDNQQNVDEPEPSKESTTAATVQKEPESRVVEDCKEEVGSGLAKNDSGGGDTTTDVKNTDGNVTTASDANNVTSDKTSATVNDQETSGAATTPTTGEQKQPDREVSRGLWISGLASKTRATDLKQVLSKYGKVIGAKIVANARSPIARCYGYVIMATVEDADNCIEHCNHTELHDRIISVGRKRPDRSDERNRYGRGRIDDRRHRSRSRSNRRRRSISRTKDKPKEKKVEGVKKDGEKDAKTKEGGDDKIDKDTGKREEGARSRGHSQVSISKQSKDGRNSRSERRNDRDSVKETTEHKSKEPSQTHSKDGRKHEEKGRSRHQSRESPQSVNRRGDRVRPRRRSGSLLTIREFHDPPENRHNVLSFHKVREEARRRQRVRVRERVMREEDARRRREEKERMRELERRNKKEATRLERERERLRIERERLQREKADLIRMERERIEQERIELQNLKMEELRRPPKRSSNERRDTYPEERKRLMLSSSSSHRYDGSDPMHFDLSSRSDSLKKHDLHKPGNDYKSRDMEQKSRPQMDSRHIEDYKNSRADMRAMAREDIRPGRDDIRAGRGDDMRSRDDMRLREDIRSSRDDYSKRDRADFAPPPPRLSGSTSNIMPKYSNVTDSPPPYVNQGRSVHEMMRREPLPPVLSSVRTSSSGIGKDIRYADRVGPPGQSPEPNPNSYRGMHDDRRNDHNDLRGSGHSMHRGYEMSSMKDYGDRDHSGSSGGGGGFYSGNQQLKQFSSPMMNTNNDSGVRGDPKKFEPWMKGDNPPPMMWRSSGMDTKPPSNRYDRSNMERR